MIRDPLYWVPIKYKLGLTFVLLALVSLGIGGAVAYYTSKAALRDRILKGIESSTTAKLENVSAYVDSLIKRTGDFSSDGFIRDAARDVQKRPSDSLRRELNSHLRKNKVSIVPDFSETLIVGESGTVLASSSPESVGTDLSTQPSVREGRHRVFVGDVRLGHEKDSRPSLGISAPLTDRVSHRFIGVILNRVKPEVFAGMLAGESPPEEGGRLSALEREPGRKFYLMDASGRLLGMAPRETLMEELSGKILSIPHVGTVEGGRAARSGIRRGYEGTEVVSAWGFIPAVGWTLVSEIETREAFRSVRVLRNRLLVVGLALVLLTGVLLFFPSKFMIDPIVRLRDAARQIGKGNFNVEVRVNSKDEIGQLANAFNQMAVGLQERVHMEHRLAHHEKITVMGEMAAAVAHEMNTPLASIVLFAQMVSQEVPPGSPLREHADVILRNAQTCGHTVRTLLGYTRKSAVEKSPFRLNDCVQESLRLCRPLLERSGIRSVVDLAEPLPDFIGDQERMRQVFVNLTMNAIQAMARGGALTVRTSRIARNGSVPVAVEFGDTGEGIAAEHLARIFDPFFTTKPEGEGTGLGLSISRRIVEEHGGRIEVDSRRGEGTRFVVFLPVNGHA